MFGTVAASISKLSPTLRQSRISSSILPITDCSPLFSSKPTHIRLDLKVGVSAITQMALCDYLLLGIPGTAQG